MSLTFEAFGTSATEGIEILNASVAASLFSLCDDLSEAHTKEGTFLWQILSCLLGTYLDTVRCKKSQRR